MPFKYQSNFKLVSRPVGKNIQKLTGIQMFLVNGGPLHGLPLQIKSIESSLKNL